VALLLVLLVDSWSPRFFQVILQDGRFGSPIDILNRAAPVALWRLV
jgi:simple sugar transport system permease protein